MKSGWGQIFQICQEARPEAHQISSRFKFDIGEQEFGLQTIRKDPKKMDKVYAVFNTSSSAYSACGSDQLLRNKSPGPQPTSTCFGFPLFRDMDSSNRHSRWHSRSFPSVAYPIYPLIIIDPVCQCLPHLFWQNRSRTGRGRKANTVRCPANTRPPGPIVHLQALWRPEFQAKDVVSQRLTKLPNFLGDKNLLKQWMIAYSQVSDQKCEQRFESTLRWDHLQVALKTNLPNLQNFADHKPKYSDPPTIVVKLPKVKPNNSLDWHVIVC